LRGFGVGRHAQAAAVGVKCPWLFFAHPTQGAYMSDLKARFEQAATDSKNLAERPDNSTLLKIYGLYKQASEGDNVGQRPGFTDMVGRMKFDAWAELKGKGSDEAMQEYIELIESLK